jgi:hypothetical protein
VLPEFFIEVRYRMRQSESVIEPGTYASVEQAPPTRVPFVPALAHASALASYARTANVIAADHPLVSASPSFRGRSSPHSGIVQSRRVVEAMEKAAEAAKKADSALSYFDLAPEHVARPEVWWAGGAIAKPALAIEAARTHVEEEQARRAAHEAEKLAKLVALTAPNRRRPRPASPPPSPTTMTSSWKTATDALVQKAAFDQRRFWSAAAAEWRAAASAAVRAGSADAGSGAAGGAASGRVSKWERYDAAELRAQVAALVAELARAQLQTAEIEHAALKKKAEQERGAAALATAYGDSDDDSADAEDGGEDSDERSRSTSPTAVEAAAQRMRAAAAALEAMDRARASQLREAMKSSGASSGESSPRAGRRSSAGRNRSGRGGGRRSRGGGRGRGRGGRGSGRGVRRKASSKHRRRS